MIWFDVSSSVLRDYDAESDRKDGVENFYRINHINQTYDFVRRSPQPQNSSDSEQFFSFCQRNESILGLWFLCTRWRKWERSTAGWTGCKWAYGNAVNFSMMLLMKVILTWMSLRSSTCCRQLRPSEKTILTRIGCTSLPLSMVNSLLHLLKSYE